MQKPINNEDVAVRTEQLREEVRKNRMEMRRDIQSARMAQQPELLVLVLEHLDLMNRAKRFEDVPADNPNKPYCKARVVEIKDYLAKIDQHITELVQQERDKLCKDNE